MAIFSVIMPAAGQSSRFKDKDKKPFAQLDGRAVWLRSAELFITRSDVVQCLVVVAPEDLEVFRRRFGANLAFMNVHIVEGGKERFDSVAHGIAKLKDDTEFVAVHDAVRPCLTQEMIDAVFAQAAKTGAAILAQPIGDTVKRVDKDHKVTETVNRHGLWLAQTPQVFRKEWLVEAYKQRGKLGNQITDDAQLVEAAGHAISVVEGDSTNVKITRKSDLFLCEAILKSRPKPKAAGPIHPFADEAKW